MGTKADGNVRLVEATRGEALGAQIAETMVERALEAIQVGGYKPSGEDFAAISRGAVRLSLALGAMIVAGVDGGAPAPSDAEIDDWVERAAHGGVLELLGPPPMAH